MGLVGGFYLLVMLIVVLSVTTAYTYWASSISEPE